MRDVNAADTNNCDERVGLPRTLSERAQRLFPNISSTAPPRATADPGAQPPQFLLLQGLPDLVRATAVHAAATLVHGSPSSRAQNSAALDALASFLICEAGHGAVFTAPQQSARSISQTGDDQLQQRRSQDPARMGSGEQHAQGGRFAAAAPSQGASAADADWAHAGISMARGALPHSQASPALPPASAQCFCVREV